MHATHLCVELKDILVLSSSWYYFHDVHNLCTNKYNKIIPYHILFICAIFISRVGHLMKCRFITNQFNAFFCADNEVYA
jgi:hypothetical protein